jgi:hypothetical protein
MDGIAIASAYQVSPALAIPTALAVAAHEIPQEVGDFGILLDSGFDRVQAFALNILSASTALIGAVGAYLASSAILGNAPCPACRCGEQLPVCGACGLGAPHAETGRRRGPASADGPTSRGGRSNCRGKGLDRTGMTRGKESTRAQIPQGKVRVFLTSLPPVFTTVSHEIGRITADNKIMLRGSALVVAAMEGRGRRCIRESQRRTM